MKKELSNKNLLDISKLYKVLGDYTKIRIIYCLYKKERNVTEICNELNMGQSAISHQLKLLKDNRLIQCKRNGKTIIYSLLDKHIYSIISQGIDHIKE